MVGSHTAKVRASTSAHFVAEQRDRCTDERHSIYMPRSGPLGLGLPAAKRVCAGRLPPRRFVAGQSGRGRRFLKNQRFLPDFVK
eukprot:5545229-Prymnesium_polylepis.1